MELHTEKHIASICCHTNPSPSNRERKAESAFLPKSKNTFSGLCCIQFVSQEYYTPAILEKQQKILHNAQPRNSFNTPKKGLAQCYTPHAVVFHRCEY